MLCRPPPFSKTLQCRFQELEKDYAEGDAARELAGIKPQSENDRTDTYPLLMQTNMAFRTGSLRTHLCKNHKRTE
jgi:hypothetical protein